MATKKSLKDELRRNYMEILKKLLADYGEEVLQVKTNEITIPVVDSQGNEDFVCFTVKVPTGSRDGELYDGYELAEDFKLQQKLKEEKKQKREEEKKAKMERDRKYREHQKKLKEQREGKGE